MTTPPRTNVTLDAFIAANRDEIIVRCRAKVAKRPAPPPTDAELADGVPHFLDQLVKELRQGPSNSQEIGESGIQHGHDLRRQGFTIGAGRARLRRYLPVRDRPGGGIVGAHQHG